MGEWFRGKDDQALNKKKTSDSGDVASDNAAAGSEANASEGGKAESPGEPSPETEGSSAGEEAETTVSTEEEVGGNDSTEGARAGEEGESAALEGVKGVVGELGGVGVGGDGSGKRSSAILSDEEVQKLRDEQDAKYKELEVNVNVFMPYKVGHIVGFCSGLVGDRKWVEKGEPWRLSPGVSPLADEPFFYLQSCLA